MEHEYISRKELIVWLMPYVHAGELVDPEVLIADIRAMKAADVVPVVHGKWDDSLDGITPYCSVCGCTHKCLIRTPLYCPNCGAKMDLED